MFERFILNERINDLRQRAILLNSCTRARATRDVESLHAETDALRRDTEELALVVRAVVTLLVDKGVIGQDELAERMVEIGGEDGVEDGRMGPTPS